MTERQVPFSERSEPIGRNAWTYVLATSLWITACANVGCRDDSRLALVEGSDVDVVLQLPAADIFAESEEIALANPDLLIGGHDAGAEHQFYRPRRVAVDTDGSIYVLDGGSHRIQVFSDAGQFLRSIGRQGQGPGEFLRGWGLALSGPEQHLTIHDQGNRRMSTWTRDGEFVDSSPTEFTLMSSMRGLEDGSIAGLYSEFDRELFDRKRGYYRVALQRFDTSGNELSRYVEGELQLEPVPLQVPRFSTDGKQRLYFGAGDEFVVTALRVADAEPVWRFELLDESGAVLSGEGAAQPIRNLQVDGHGHIYVWGSYDSPSADGPYPVAVLSPAGSLLASGTFELRGFHAARGDHVYRLEEDDSLGEVVLRRYRLVEHFEE